MAMAPRGGGLISTAPTGGSAPSSLIVGCWVCLDKAGVSLPEAREPEERGDQKQTDESLVAELARLSPFEYDRKRKDTAKAIGITVATLDKAVAERRGHANAKDADLPHWSVEPWPEAVSGDRLLNALAMVFSRYVILPNHAADALALWVVHAWAFDASPFMVLVSPEKRCGKSTVLIILQFLTPRSELAGNISAAAVFRYLEDERPTLLIDEVIRSSKTMRKCGAFSTADTPKPPLTSSARSRCAASIGPSDSPRGRPRRSPRYGRSRTRLRIAPSS
jgi:hypothetical protein